MLEKLLSLISSKIITISRQQKRELVNLGIASSAKINIIPLGFDFTNILPSPSDHKKFKNIHKIPQDSKITGIIGRLTGIKNHELFIQIAERLLKKFKNVYFPIIGDGELKEYLQDIINKKGLSKNVFITGFITDLKSVYADLDVVLLTSINEGTPVAIIESMAASKLVCCTNVGGISDFIDNTVDGFYFDSLAPEPFVDLLSNWIADPSSYKEVQKQAQKKASKYFEETRLIKDIEYLYIKMCERKNR